MVSGYSTKKRYKKRTFSFANIHIYNDLHKIYHEKIKEKGKKSRLMPYFRDKTPYFP